MNDRTQFIRPSGAVIWSRCPAYAKLCAAIAAALPSDYEEEADTDIREDGTACHWLAAEVWEGREPPVESFSPNAREITDEMYEGVALWHELLNSWPNVAPVIEQKVPVSRVVWGVQDGTPDAYAFDPSTYTLYVGDFKFGFRFVEVWKNLQLVLYALGIICQLDLDLSRLTIKFYICQPRAFHHEGQVREWVCSGPALLPIKEELQVAAMATMGPDPACVVNPGCFNCMARASCHAYQSAALQAMHVSGAAITNQLTPFQLGNELRVMEEAAKILEGRITGLREQAEYAIRKQRAIIPHYDLKPRIGRERFVEGAEEKVLKLAPAFNVDAAKPVRAKTPAQLRKAGYPEHVLSMYVEKPVTGVKLTRADDADKKFAKWSQK